MQFVCPTERIWIAEFVGYTNYPFYQSPSNFLEYWKFNFQFEREHCTEYITLDSQNKHRRMLILLWTYNEQPPAMLPVRGESCVEHIVVTLIELADDERVSLRKLARAQASPFANIYARLALLDAAALASTCSEQLRAFEFMRAYQAKLYRVCQLLRELAEQPRCKFLQFAGSLSNAPLLADWCIFQATALKHTDWLSYVERAPVARDSVEFQAPKRLKSYKVF
jgi:hypothetical protein